MEQQNETKFEYTYSAPTERERREIESIRKQYVAEEKTTEDAIERIKALNAKVNGGATTLALILGIVGILTFGLGLTMVLEWDIWLWGIILMAVGCIPMALAYPSHTWMIKKGRKKYGEEIVRLSDEILNK
jgi:hypothetical protein